jgi:ACS family hexuronate transporter-like MFS transporter
MRAARSKTLAFADPQAEGEAAPPWRIAFLVSAAIAISYLDRQTLPVAVHAIEKDIPLSNQQFSNLQSMFLFSYALMYAGGGKLVDALGTRRGFTFIMVLWSLACASHALATTVFMLAVSRFLLGMGEGGGFPAATLPSWTWRWATNSSGTSSMVSPRRRTVMSNWPRAFPAWG